MKAINGQMSLFDLIEKPQDEVWDKDIVEIISKLDNVAEQHGMGASYKWEVWEHVPYLGFRLSFEFRGMRNQFTNTLLADTQKVCDYAKSLNVELSIISPVFFDDEAPQYMDVYSMFKAKERQKIKRGEKIERVLREFIFLAPKKIPLQ